MPKVTEPAREPDEEPERPEKALLDQYVKKFGKEPAYFSHEMVTDMAGALRRALKSGKPIELDIGPDEVA